MTPTKSEFFFQTAQNKGLILKMTVIVCGKADKVKKIEFDCRAESKNATSFLIQ
jgi:hypothetical protein